MKKRVKLFTTIASLCMAIALMAFGVYAASAQSLKVTSTVKFNVGENIAFTLTGSVADKYEHTGTLANRTAKVDTTALEDVTDDTALEVRVADDTVVYTFKITNTGSNKIKITLGETKTLPGYFATEDLVLGGADTAIAVGATDAEFTVTYTGTGAATHTENQADGQIVFTLNFAYAA